MCTYDIGWNLSTVHCRMHGVHAAFLQGFVPKDMFFHSLPISDPTSDRELGIRPRIGSVAVLLSTAALIV